MALLSGLGLASAAGAAVYNVPGNYGSIQGALNNVPNGSTVLVAPGTYAESIFLGNFNRDITVIATGGPDVTSIDGGGTSRLLFIDNSGIAPSRQLVFHGFTFANGKSTTTGGNGSPVSINNSSPVFIDCVFRNNRSRHKGGAVLVFDGFGAKDTRVTFKDCLFDANKSDANGGAVLGNGGRPLLVFDGCTFQYNTTRTSLSSNYNQGGALYLNDANGLVSRCTFTTNSANYTSGAIGILYQNWVGLERKLTVTDSTFTGNFAKTVSGRTPAYPGPTEGGAILSEDNVGTTISRSTFYDHESDSGCTLHSYRANLTVEDSVIEEGNTTATGGGIVGGGGIALSNDDPGGVDHRQATLTVRNSLIRNCTSHAGGAIFVGGDPIYNHPAQVLIENTSLIGNEAVQVGASRGFGSALRANLANVTFVGGFIANNYADVAGAVVSEGNAAVQINNSFVVGNTAGITDDDFHYAGGTIITSGSTVAYNGGSGGTANTAGLLAAPAMLLQDKAYLAYFVAPFSGSPTIQPSVGALPDQDGYASGLAEISGVDQTTAYTLDSQYPDLIETSVWVDVRQPYPGSAPVASVTIEAENYNDGGASIAYYDRTAGNDAGGGRTAEDVDVTPYGAASGGAFVSSLVAGEYLDYAVDIPATGEYTIGVRAASPGLGGTLHVEWNGQMIGGVFTVPDTGGWATWQWAAQTGIVLNAGSGQLRLVMRANATHGYIGNFDAIEISAPIDSDGDGIADAWELDHFVNLDVANATSDYDLDGSTDIQEFLAATDPKDDADFLKIATLTTGAGGLTIAWESRSNVVYTIRRTGDLPSGFTALSTGITATPPTNSYLDPVGLDPECFYQIEVE